MSLICHRLFHAGYQIKSAEALILIDPLLESQFSVNVESFPLITFDLDQIKLLSIDAIFISHIHDDHLSLTSLNQLNRQISIYLYSPIHSRIFSLIKSLGFINVFPLEVFTSYEVKDIKVQIWPALENDIDCVLSIHSCDTHILNVVDAWLPSGILPQLQRYNWDLVLWPFQYMRELNVLSPDRFKQCIQSILPEHVEQLTKLQMSYLVMSSCQIKMQGDSWLNQHYFSLSYRQFMDQLQPLLSKTKIIKLNPGQGIGGFGTAEVGSRVALNYLSLLTPDAESEYFFNPLLVAPSLATLSPGMGQLSIAEKLFLQNFIKYALSNLLNLLKWDAESLFMAEQFTWQLITYDQRGNATSYYFIRARNEFYLSSSPPTSVDWVTEIAETRGYQALTKGYPLTCLNLQIARAPLSKRGEAYLQEAYQLMEDPLIKVLYTANPLRFFDFQYAQIRLGFEDLALLPS